MINKVQEIYPSSKVPQQVIDSFGRELLETVPTVYRGDGSLASSEEASEYFKQLRGEIDDAPTIRLQTEHGLVEIEDFAVARLPHSDVREQFGFFGLNPSYETNK